MPEEVRRWRLEDDSSEIDEGRLSFLISNEIKISVTTGCFILFFHTWKIQILLEIERIKERQSRDEHNMPKADIDAWLKLFEFFTV